MLGDPPLAGRFFDGQPAAAAAMSKQLKQVMKLRLSKNRSAGLTLFEVGVVIAIVLILVVLILPRLARARTASHINCINNLKQVGLACRIWEGDNGDLYPMAVSVTSGGSREMVTTGNVVQTFQVMSNELSTPKILVCSGRPNPHRRTGV